MSNFILKNISGSDLSLPILEGTTAETLSNNQTINLLEFVSVSDAEKSLKFGDLKTNLANGNISLIKNSIGFVNRYNCVLQTILDDIDDGYISFSISPVEASFSFNQQLNTLDDLSVTTYTKNTQELLAIPYVINTPAIYRVYYEDDTLSYENINDKTSYNFSDINKTEVCNIWYDGYFAYTFDLRQESYEPWVEGILQEDQNQLRYKSGLQVTISSELDPGQVIISPGYVTQNTSKLFLENNIMSPLYAPILYRETSTTNSNHNNWKTTFNATSLITLDNNGNVAYNKYESNSWFVFPSTNGYYVPYWIVATNCIEYPIMIIVGQNQYDSLENAIYHSRFDKLKIDNALIRNFKPLYRTIIKNETEEQTITLIAPEEGFSVNLTLPLLEGDLDLEASVTGPSPDSVTFEISVGGGAWETLISASLVDNWEATKTLTTDHIGLVQIRAAATTGSTTIYSSVVNGEVVTPAM